MGGIVPLYRMKGSPMATSYLDEYMHQFTCDGPECRKTFKHVLRSLIEPDEVTCPYCGVVKDIRESKLGK